MMHKGKRAILVMQLVWFIPFIFLEIEIRVYIDRKKRLFPVVTGFNFLSSNILIFHLQAPVNPRRLLQRERHLVQTCEHERTSCMLFELCYCF